MNSQLSIELIYTILFAVTEHTVGALRIQTDWKVYSNHHFLNRNEIVIECLAIKNPEALQVVKDVNFLRR